MSSVIPQPDLHDPTSPAYKKARKLFLKSTKNRNNDTDHDWTPFRAAEKRYKARFPPPDLANVLDLALLDEGRADEIDAGVWRGRSDAQGFIEIPLRGGGKGYILPRIPGLVLLPSFLSHEKQRELVRWSLSEHSRPPNETNLDTHYVLPPEGIWNVAVEARKDPSREVEIPPCHVLLPSDQKPEVKHGPRVLINNTPANTENFDSLSHVSKPPAPPSQTAASSTSVDLLPKLRWANIGWFYHWGSKQYDFTKGKVEVHPKIRDVCQNAVHSVNWGDVFSADSSDWGKEDDWRTWGESYEPDAGIVNFYQTKDTLMAHVDRSEVCATSPLVSISLGNAAVFLIGGPTRDTEPIPILLRSGDIVIMSGPGCRRAYHGVPRILEGTLPRHMFGPDESGEYYDWKPYEDYMRTTRINVNVRQVFPKGFDPGIPV
ncbi:hypothetical protein V5O48_002033 [Marasmius crinis-equi]|uniref:Fe2OG dioxygenase domain-containing protein n=1 Tax=Marasmius crinis-equi TaxID=585013 RepID=A0ABR3FWW7_9AGAR